MTYAESEAHILQKVIDKLVRDYGYLPDQIVIGPRLAKGAIADAIIYEDVEKKSALIIIEVKRHLVYPIAAHQIEHYLKLSGAKYGLLTDGKVKSCFQSVGDRILKIPNIPKRGEEEKKTLLKRELKSKTGLEYSLQKIRDYLEAAGLHLDKTMRELQKLIFCKLSDERSSEEEAKFWLSPEETRAFLKPEVRMAFVGRISSLFEEVKETYPELYSRNEKLELDAETLSYAVAELQDYSLTKMPLPSLSATYQDFIIKSMRGYLGEYSTPRFLVRFIVEMLDPAPEESILDPACGTGSLLIESMHYVDKKIDSIGATNVITMKEEYAKSKLYGIDINSKMVSMSKMNMVLHGDGHANIFQGNSLSQLENLKAYLPQSFDVVVVDPPSGGYVSDAKILRHYSLGRGRKSQRIPVLFIEKCLEMLKPGGRMAAIVPEAILANVSFRYVRKFILKNAVPEAIVGLPHKISLLYSGVKLNILFLRKTVREWWDKSKYYVFMAEVDEEAKESIEEIIAQYLKFKSENKRPSSKRIFTIRASALGRRWDVGSHMPLELDLSRTEPLGKLCQILSGSKVSSRKYLEGPREDLTPYIRISDIVDGGLAEEGLKFVTKEIPGPRVQVGDVLFSVRGTIGKTAIITEAFEGSIASSQLTILRPRRGLINPNYLSRVLLSETVSKQIDRAKIGQFIPYISLGDLRRIFIPYCSLKEQLEIVKRINRLEKEAKKMGLTKKKLERRIKRILSEVGR